MISYLFGKVLKIGISKNNYIDILLNSGIGHRVFVTDKFAFSEIGSDLEIFTSFQVREDSQSLYGFNTEKERDFFEELLTVSGIGPRTALSILSTNSMEKVKEIILNADSKLLSKTPGLGLKGSQKVILELRGKIDFDKEDEESRDDKKLGELKDALKVLGFKGNDLDECVKRGGEILKEEDIEIELLIKSVLQNKND